MSNVTITSNSIVVHSRGSLKLPYKVFDLGVQRDISAATYYFEVDGIPIRKALVVNPADALGKLLTLNRTEVQSLTNTPMKFSVIDETDAAFPIVMWDGSINRLGYLGAPDTVVD